MSDSILESTKKVLGLPPEYTVFDSDIIMHINSVFTTLNQLGIGPEHGFAIEDSSTTWTSYLGTQLGYSPVKSYMALRVRLLFDPPATSFHITAIKEQIQEFEWRLSVQRENGVTTLLLGGHKKITGNLGDKHKIRLSSPPGQNLINSSGQYQVTFLSKNDQFKDSYGTLDLAQVASGILILSFEVQSGTYTVRSITLQRTILVLEVTAQ